MAQTFKQLAEYPNYFISRSGDLQRRSSAGRKQVARRDENNVIRVTLIDTYGRICRPALAELVAETFLSHTRAVGEDYVVHLDGDGSNCSVDNLVWTDLEIYPEFCSRPHYRLGITKQEGDSYEF